MKSPFSSISPRVIEVQQITNQNLLDLAEGRILALVIHNYFPRELCQQMTAKLLHDTWYGEYENVPNVHKWGLNTYEGLSSPEQERKYFRDAVPAIQTLRKLWFPTLSPIDRLRLELQENWPAGANMERFEGQKLFVGQARVFENGNGALPHQDFLPWELEPNRAPSLMGQMTVNLYLQTPTHGGELELWAQGYDREEYDALRAGEDSYGLYRDLLPPPDAMIKPEPGMLTMFHASRVHAVRPSEGRDRVAISCFIGLRGLDQPITYWS